MKAKKDFLVSFAYYACICLLIYVCFGYLMPLMLPFIFGFLFATLSHSITKDKNTLVLIIIYIVVGLILLVFFSGLAGVITDWIYSLPSFYKNSIEPVINQLYEKLMSLNDTYTIPGFADMLDTAFSVLKNSLSSVASTLISLITSGVGKLPNVFFSVMIFVISSFYFTTDYDTVDAEFSKIGVVKQWANEKIFKLFKCYGILILLTCFELTIGFLILGIDSPFSLALIISLIDIMPVLGTGTVLIPWGLVLLILGDMKGVGILILYVIITVVRQYVEPKLVGANLGIPAILSLIVMVLGLRLFGLLGMMGLPLLLSYYFYSRDYDKNHPAEAPVSEKPLPEAAK